VEDENGKRHWLRGHRSVEDVIFRHGLTAGATSKLVRSTSSSASLFLQGTPFFLPLFCLPSTS
jgi:hypothetical protein